MRSSARARTSTAEVSFPALGGDALVIVHGDAGLAKLARLALERLERRWNRFDPDSDVGRVNAHAGSPVVVSPETVTLVEMAVAAWHATRGAFDPTLGTELALHGYDRSFDTIDPEQPVVPPELPARISTCADVVVDADASTVQVPPDVHLDLGGIAPGHALDEVAGLVMARGAVGVAVSVNGDVRVAGEAPGGHGWGVIVPSPDGAAEGLAMLAVADGGVATSSVWRRRWRTTDGEAHHVLDPRTRRPAETDLLQATVLAVDAASADVLATTALLVGADRLGVLAGAAGVAVLALTTGGERVEAGDLAPFLR